MPPHGAAAFDLVSQVFASIHKTVPFALSTDDMQIHQTMQNLNALRKVPEASYASNKPHVHSLRQSSMRVAQPSSCARHDVAHLFDATWHTRHHFTIAQKCECCLAVSCDMSEESYPPAHACHEPAQCFRTVSNVLLKTFCKIKSCKNTLLTSGVSSRGTRVQSFAVAKLIDQMWLALSLCTRLIREVRSSSSSCL
jgi:hypothetical protein